MFKTFIPWIKDKLNKRPIVRNIGLLTSGTILAQIVSITASPFLTRLFSPEDFGIQNTFLSLLAILNVAAALRFELVIPLVKQNKIASQMVMLSIFAVFFSSTIVLIFIIILHINNYQLFNIQISNNYLFLIPISLLFSGFYLVFNYWAIRIERFEVIAKTKLFQALNGTVAQIILGLLGVKPLGLIIGSIIKQASGGWRLFRVYKKTSLMPKPNLNIIVKLAQKYKRYPLVSSWSSIVNVLSLNLPVLLLSKLYGFKIAGYFGFSLMIISLPVTLVGKSISQVFIGQASKLIGKDLKQLKKLYNRIIKTLFFIGVLPALFLFSYGPQLFAFVFGENWYISGVIVRTLSLVFLFQFILIPTSQLLNIIQRQSIQFIWDFIRFIFILSSILIPSILEYTYLQTIVSYSITMIAFYIILYVIHVYELNTLKPTK